MDVARAAVGLDEAMAAQDGQVLGQVRRLEAGLRLELGDGVLLAVGEQLEKSDPERVRQAFEQSRLDLVEGALAAGERLTQCGMMKPSYRVARAFRPRTGTSSTNGPRHGSESIRRGEDLTLDLGDEG